MELSDFDNINCLVSEIGDKIVLLDESEQKKDKVTKVEYLVSAFYSQGQLLRGVEDGPYSLCELASNAFGSKKHILVKPTHDTIPTTESEIPWQDDYEKLYDVLKTIPMYVMLGGDHSIGMSSVAASIYKTPDVNNLYVIWIDAHADTNTMVDSITKNIHGQPLAGIMGYEEPWFKIEETLPTTNLLYFGIRDLDDYEKEKIRENNIFNTRNLQEMLTTLEYIMKNNSEAVFHISFDVDALDSTIMSSTGCVVKDGLFPTDVSSVYNFVKPKLIAFDLVEYNPNLGDSKTSFNSIKKIIEDITK